MYGTGNGKFNYPTGVAVDAIGDVYVADLYNHRIQKFTSGGTYLTQWGTYGTGNGQFDLPTRMAVNGIGDLYVADSHNYRILEFGPVPTPATQETWGELKARYRPSTPAAQDK